MLPRDIRMAVHRRVDYRPPAFLHRHRRAGARPRPGRHEVTARLAFRRNPAPRRGPRGAAVLDGEQQSDVSVELDGAPLPPERWTVDAARLTVVAPPDAGTLVVRSRIAPLRNVSLEGLYVSSSVFCTQCEPKASGASRTSPTGRTCSRASGHAARRPARLSGAAVERQARRRRARCRRPSLRDLARPLPQALYLFALVAGDLPRSRHVHHGIGPRRGAAHLLDAREPAALPSRDGVAEARDALGRGALRPRVRPRHVHDLLRRRLQHGRDGEQGPQHLQQPPRARRSRVATDADYTRSKASSGTSTSTTGPAIA
jgi:hypothetical protein